MPRPFGSRIVLSPELRQQLADLVRARSIPKPWPSAAGLSGAPQPTNQPIAGQWDCGRHTVGQRRERCAAHGLAGAAAR